MRTPLAVFFLLGVSQLALAGPSVVMTEVSQADPEFVELHNPGTTPVDLLGYRLSGDVTYSFTEKAVVPPGGYLTLVGAVRPFKRAFGDDPVVVGPLWQRLRDQGATLRLLNPQEAVIDEVRYGAHVDGQSLQRISPTTAYRGLLNWFHAPPTAGAPSVKQAELPPLLMDRPRLTPEQPTSLAAVRAEVRVHGASQRVRVHWRTRNGTGSTLLAAESAEGGARVYRGTLPQLPDQTLLDYWFVAQGSGGTQQVLRTTPWGAPLRAFVFDDGVGTQLPLYCLEVPPDRVKGMATRPGRERFPTTVAVINSGVATLRTGTIQARGSGTRSWPKQSWLITLGETYRGRTRLYLRTNQRDATFLREVLAYDLFRRAGVVTPHARLVRVHLNGAFHGVYTEVDNPGPHFLAKHAMPDAVLYQALLLPTPDNRIDGATTHPTPIGYERSWEKKTHADEPWDDLRSFIEGFHAAEHKDLEAYFERHLDVERYLSYLAVCALISHWDSQSKNYFWCLDRGGSGKWTVIPWDVDLTWGDYATSKLVPTVPLLLGTKVAVVVTDQGRALNFLRNRFLSVMPLRRRFYRRVLELADREFVVERLEGTMDRLLKTHQADLILDRQRWGVVERVETRVIKFDVRHLVREVGLMKHYIRSRRKYVIQECRRALSKLPPEPPVGSKDPPALLEDPEGELRVDLILLALLILGVGVYVGLGKNRDTGL